MPSPTRPAAQTRVAEARAASLQSELLAWFERVRRDLPWRRTKDPYAVWLSEIMLQQTRAATVIPYFERFLRELPTVKALAEAPTDQVMSLWSGLGYYRRARMLHEAAAQVAKERGGVLPRTAAELAKVRGIGPYTAGAIASIAFGERTPLVDGNVARVLARLFAITSDVQRGAGLKQVWSIAGALVPEGRAGDWNEALMELGATTCIPRTPRCLVCPVENLCDARAQGIAATLPVVTERTPPIAVRQMALVATLRGKVVLVRRRPGGLFGKLWEAPVLPFVEGEEAAAAAFSEALSVPIRKIERRGLVTHTLSHRRLEVDVLTTKLSRSPRLASEDTYDALMVVPVEEFPKLGMASFAGKVLHAAGIVEEAAARRLLHDGRD